MAPDTFRLVVTAQDQTTGPKVLAGSGITVHIAGTFTATVKLQIRPPLQASGALWALDTDGWVDLASWTAATDPASDTTVNTYPLFGVWHARLVCSAYTSGTANCYLGVQNAAYM